MTSEDWKTVLLALITMMGTAFATFAAICLQILRDKARTIDAKMDLAANAATEAKATAVETRKLINGRMDELLRAAELKGYTMGKAEGLAQVAQAVAESPQVSLDAQGVAKALSDSAKGLLKWEKGEGK